MSEFINAKQISKKLDICYANALSFIKHSGISYTKIGRVYRVEAGEFDTFIKNNKNICIEEDFKHEARNRSYKEKSH